LSRNSGTRRTSTLPFTLGLSGHKYYEFGTTENPAFGYVQFGPVFAVPLACIPKSFGTWTVKGVAEFVFLGELLYIERARLYAAGASHDRERLMVSLPGWPLRWKPPGRGVPEAWR
jgi:hypothetical protein